ncbi:MAG: helix-turn-helix domain-containing protein [Ruminococcus sp.]
MAFYQRIRDLREDSDKTQSEIAEYLGTTAQYYGKYEKGERELPFLRAIQLADFYNVSLDYIAGRTNVPSAKPEDSLSDESKVIAHKYMTLTERSKGKLELFLDQLCESQKENIHLFKEAK